MKKLLFLFMLLLSLCACSSDDGEAKEIRNVFTYDGKEYLIDKVVMDKHEIRFYSGTDYLDLNNCDYEIGKKCYLSGYDMCETALVSRDKETGYENTVDYINVVSMTQTSYVTVKYNDEDNRTSIELYATNGKKVVTVHYLGVTFKRY